MQHLFTPATMQGSHLPKAPRRIRHYVCSIGAVLLISSTGIAGCASSSHATDGIRAAEVAIAHAEQARVADYTSPELIDARTKLAASRSELKARHEVQAEQLAEQARLSAELAMAKSQAAKAEAVNAETRKSTEVLKQEMQRQNGAQQ